MPARLTQILLASALLLTFACACGGSDSSTPQCAHNGDCLGTDVCLGGECVNAFEPFYEVSLDVQVAQREPDGTAWDSDGSPPDVQPTITTSGNFGDQLAQWDVDEAFHASFSSVQVSFAEANAAGTSIVLNIVDQDSIGYDDICTLQIDDVAAFLHSGETSLPATSCEVTIRATPTLTP